MSDPRPGPPTRRGKTPEPFLRRQEKPLGAPHEGGHSASPNGRTGVEGPLVHQQIPRMCSRNMELTSDPRSMLWRQRRSDDPTEGPGDPKGSGTDTTPQKGVGHHVNSKEQTRGKLNEAAVDKCS